MGKNIKCSKCGHLLAKYSGETGLHRQMKFFGARVRVEKNALGEDLGWAICPKCKAQTRIDASYLPGSDK
jgi:phage FluMu protein Com